MAVFSPLKLAVKLTDNKDNAISDRVVMNFNKAGVIALADREHCRLQ
jgi:hypothetical protein